MQHEPRLTPAQQKIEALLGQLAPQAGGLNRDVLMFQAGRHSSGSKRPWQAACGVLAVLFCSLLMRPPGEVGPAPAQVAEVRLPEAASVQRPPSSLAYLKLQRQVMQEGLEVLPRTRSRKAHGPASSPRQLLASLLSS